VPEPAAASAAAADNPSESKPRADRGTLPEAPDAAAAQAEAEAVQNAARVTAAAADVDNVRSRIEARRREIREQAAQRQQDAGAP
jgi:molecular chaperone GrpE (heat shock protein)